MSTQNLAGKASLLSKWPERIDQELVILLGDKHMIAAIENKPHAEVMAFQARRLTQLLSHAAQHSVWWRHRIGKGNKVNFQNLPLTSRTDLRVSIEKQSGPLPLPQGHGYSFNASTSGSSGVPVEFYTSTLASRINKAYYWFDRDKQCIDPQKTIARFSVHLDNHTGEHLERPGIPEIMRSPELHRRPQQFSIEEHAVWLTKVNPAYVISHPTLLSGIMDVYEDGVVKAPKIEKLLTFAETVTPTFREKALRVANNTAQRSVGR